VPCTGLHSWTKCSSTFGTSVDRSVIITEIAEVLSKQLDSQVMLVGAGQSALTGQELLAKMLDRFLIRVQLSDTDVEVVTREVLLQKQPTARSEVEKLLSRHAGEVSRQHRTPRSDSAPATRTSSSTITAASRTPPLLGGVFSPSGCRWHARAVALAAWYYPRNRWERLAECPSDRLFPPINFTPCGFEADRHRVLPAGSMTASPLWRTH